MSSNSIKRYQIVFLAGAVLALAACSGGTTTGTGTATVTGTVTAAANKIVGSWARCNVTGATSNKVVTGFGAISAGPLPGGFNGQQSASQKTDFTDASCQDGGTFDTSQGTGTFLYLLGSGVTVDGTVAGITAATQYGGPDPESESLAEFDIIAANATQLFFGDKSTNTGATLALQPTQIETAAYTKQVALTPTALIGTWSLCGKTDSTAAGNSAKIALTLTATTFSSIETAFTGTTVCDSGSAATVIPEPANTANYVLGNQVTVNGTVKGITNATQFTTTDAIGTEFSLIAINASGTQLFIGDTDAAQSGTSEALRATQLDNDVALTKE
jgi:hypothetical protein